MGFIPLILILILILIHAAKFVLALHASPTDRNSKLG